MVIDFPKSHAQATGERVFITGLMVWKCVYTEVCVVVSMCVCASVCIYAHTHIHVYLLTNKDYCNLVKSLLIFKIKILKWRELHNEF